MIILQNLCAESSKSSKFELNPVTESKQWTLAYPTLYKMVENISEFNIRTNDIFEKCTLFDYPCEENILQILNYYLSLAKHFIYTNKLKYNNTLDLYSYLELLKRKIYIEKAICTHKINHNSVLNLDLLVTVIPFVTLRGEDTSA